jgi:uncharacterized protein involved in exopolysaccharide biosynthesis
MSQTYAEIMTSEAIASRVVDRLHLDTLTAPPHPRWWIRTLRWLRAHGKLAIVRAWEFVRYGRIEAKDPYIQAVEDVVDGLEAEPIEDTYLFRLTASWRDPEFAARIADAASNIFVDYTGEARRSEDGTTAEFLSERLSVLRKELEDSREAVREFVGRTRTASLAQQLSLTLEAKSNFEVEREETGKQLQEVRAEIEALREQLAGQSEEVHAETTRDRNPVILDLQSDLARAEAELAGLSETRMPTHPDVRTIKAKIAKLEERISAGAVQVRSRDTSRVNPIHREIEETTLNRSAILESLNARAAALDGSIERYRRAVDELSERSPEQARLVLEVEVLEERYRLVSREYAEARLAAAQEISEIRILAPAMAPVYPVSPVKIYYVAASLVIGFLAAMSLVLIVDYTDPRIRSGEEAERVLGAPIYATMPKVGLPARTVALLSDGDLPSTNLSSRLLSDENRSVEGAVDRVSKS